jgi:hypothetical protein
MAKATPAELTESKEAINRNHAQRGVAIEEAEAEVSVGSFGCLTLFRENWESVYTSSLSTPFSIAPF